jgi:hypothetical protein
MKPTVVGLVGLIININHDLVVKWTHNMVTWDGHKAKQSKQQQGSGGTHNFGSHFVSSLNIVYLLSKFE